MLTRSPARMAAIITCCTRRIPQTVPGLAPMRASFASIAGPDVTVVQEVAAKSSEPPARQLLLDRQLPDMHRVNGKLCEPRQVWIDNWENTDPLDKRGLIPLHPLVFASYPRVDLIHEVVEWQKNYREVDWTKMFVRDELAGKGPRPWPAKGTGRARHRDKRSPIWHEGGWAHPPRGPKSKFYMPDFQVRVQALAAALSAKLAQNDLLVVDSIEHFPHAEPDELKSFIDERSIGPSTLIVDVDDMFPRNLALAAEGVKYVNLMPVYGLNVYSMLKHETLVLTVAAVELLEQRLLAAMYRSDSHKLSKKFVPPPVGRDRDPVTELPTVEYVVGDMDDLH